MTGTSWVGWVTRWWRVPSYVPGSRLVTSWSLGTALPNPKGLEGPREQWSKAGPGTTCPQPKARVLQLSPRPLRPPRTKPPQAPSPARLCSSSTVHTPGPHRSLLAVWLRPSPGLGDLCPWGAHPQVPGTGMRRLWASRPRGTVPLNSLLARGLQVSLLGCRRASGTMYHVQPGCPDGSEKGRPEVSLAPVTQAVTVRPGPVVPPQGCCRAAACPVSRLLAARHSGACALLWEGTGFVCLGLGLGDRLGRHLKSPLAP